MTLIQHSNKSSEWYTPAWIMHPARKLLGTIDLDPASSAIANQVIGAQQWYSEANSGLGKSWLNGEEKTSNIWLNPPSPAVLWWKELMTQNSEGNVRHALFMAYNIQLAQVSQCKAFPSILDFNVCWFNRRIQFEGAGKRPVNASALVYVPGTVDRSEEFRRAFSPYGRITQPYPSDDFGRVVVP